MSSHAVSWLGQRAISWLGHVVSRRGAPYNDAGMPMKRANERRRRLPLGTMLLALSIVSIPATAVAAGDLPLPRYASLKASEVNLRTGPGKRYPVDWVYARRNMPVEIVAEFDTWRKIRDWTGTVGWVHQSMLSGRRTAIVTVATQKLRKEPSLTAPAVAVVRGKVVGQLTRCNRRWCRLEIRGFSGWLPKQSLWGARAGEKFD